MIPIGADPDASPIAPATAGQRASAGRTERDHRSGSVAPGMRDFPGRIRAFLRGVERPAEAGPLPLAAGAMLANEWLAPHLVRWPPRTLPGAERPGKS